MIRKYIIPLVMLVQTFMPTAYVLAASQLDLNSSYGGVPLTSDTTESCGTGTTTLTGPQNVFIVGDSLSVGATEEYNQVFTDKGWTVEIEANGGWTASKTVAEGVIEEHSEFIDKAAIAVVELGPNIDNGDYAVQIEAVLGVLRGINPNIIVFWVNIGSTYIPDSYSTINASIEDNAASNKYTVIDWFRQVYPDGDPRSIDATLVDNNGYLAGDQLHMTSGGQQALAQFIFDEVSTKAMVEAPGGGGSGTLPTTIPAQWRNLILQAASKWPDTDPRTVAATLWVENRGWPEYKTSGYAQSGAAARGPWQFIPQSWFGWSPPPPTESWGDGTNYLNESLYKPSALAVDGNGDGVKNPEDPVDQVEAAFNLLKGTAGKPIAANWDGGNVQDGFNTAIFNRDGNSLLSHIASYNGSGATSGATIAGQPNNENGTYVKMAFWVLATDFVEGAFFDGGTARYVDVATTGAYFGGNNEGSTTSGVNGGASCTLGGTDIAAINADGYAFPADFTKDLVRSYKHLPCTEEPCHHDGTPAFDLAHKDAVGSDPGAGRGTAVFAIYDGYIERMHEYYDTPGCVIFQLVGDDGWKYAYIHLENPTMENGQKVSAGEKIAEISTPRCGRDTISHLHIDRGSPQGRAGGSDCCRDRGIIPLINTLYNIIPEE